MKFSYLTKNNVRAIPKTAGVYVFLKGTNILYIGKAANLRDRVKNHFTQPSWRDNLFITQINRIGYCETNSEIDALLLESSLIKKRQPKYNVIWKDDKGYFYVVTTKEKLPRVFLTHQPSLLKSDLGRTKSDLSREYIGPFVDGKAIKQVLRLLRKVFPYYTARKHPALSCPYCHIGLCPGPEPDVKAYNRNIKNLAAVLKGRRVSVLRNLKRAMRLASKEQDFEKAAEIRDQILSLENIVSHAFLTELRYPSLSSVKERCLPKPWSGYQRIEAYDISNIQGKQSTGSMVTFLNGKPAKEWYRKFKIHITGKQNDFAMMQELISRRLKHTEWPYPDLMLIDGGKGQLTSALKALKNAEFLISNSQGKIEYKIQDTPHQNKFSTGQAKYKIQVLALAKRNNELFSSGSKDPVLLKSLPQEVSNLLLHIRDEAHRFAISYHRKLRKKSVLE